MIMKKYTIEFTDAQLQDLVNVICEAPVARRITDPIMAHLQSQVDLLDAQRGLENGEEKPKEDERIKS